LPIPIGSRASPRRRSWEDLSWFPWTGQGTEPASKWRVDETKEFQRWTAKRKVELLLQLIRGERKLVDVCCEHDLKQSEVEGWMARKETRAQRP
jgi:hypothetical protein